MGKPDWGCVSNWSWTWMILLSNSDMKKTVNLLGIWCFSIKSEKIIKPSFGEGVDYCSFKSVRNKGKQPGLTCAEGCRKMQNKSVVYSVFLPKYDSLFLLSGLYCWEHLITRELQTDFAQWLRLKDASWYHKGNQKSLRRAACQTSCLGQGKICFRLAKGTEEWKSTLELQTFGCLRYTALFLLWLLRTSCPRSSYLWNLLVW